MTSYGDIHARWQRAGKKLFAEFCHAAGVDPNAFDRTPMTDQKLSNACAAYKCEGTTNIHPRYCDRCMQQGTPRFNEMAAERQRKREASVAPKPK
jgi:regulator of sigma D